MSHFVEVKARVRGKDGAHSTEKRLVNLDDVVVVTPRADGREGAILHMRTGTVPPLFETTEDYSYWSSILTADQPRMTR